MPGPPGPVRPGPASEFPAHVPEHGASGKTLDPTSPTGLFDRIHPRLRGHLLGQSRLLLVLEGGLPFGGTFLLIRKGQFQLSDLLVLSLDQHLLASNDLISMISR